MRQASGLLLHHAFPFLLLETDIILAGPRYGNREVLSMDCPLYNSGNTAAICTDQAFRMAQSEMQHNLPSRPQTFFR